MTKDIRFALIYARDRTDERVLAFDSLDRLCKTIHQARDGAALQLQDDDRLFQGETEKRHLVSVYTLDDAGGRHRFLGHAWLGGRGRDALDNALRRVQPEAMPIGMAA